MLAEAVEAVRQPDPRLKHVDYTPGLEAAGRRVTNSVSPVTKAATRRLRSLEAGEPQLIAASSISFRQFPQAASISFLERKVFDTKEEDDAQAWLVRVYPDDRVEVGQTRGQMWEQARLVGLGFIVGRIDDNGGYVPLGFNPETGEWQPVAEGDDVVFRDAARGENGWQFK